MSRRLVVVPLFATAVVLLSAFRPQPARAATAPADLKQQVALIEATLQQMDRELGLDVYMPPVGVEVEVRLQATVKELDRLEGSTSELYHFIRMLVEKNLATPAELALAEGIAVAETTLVQTLRGEIQVERQIITDEVKNHQLALQTTDSVNQQANYAGSILDQLSALMAEIYR